MLLIVERAWTNVETIFNVCCCSFDKNVEKEENFSKYIDGSLNKYKSTLNDFSVYVVDANATDFGAYLFICDFGSSSRGFRSHFCFGV